MLHLETVYEAQALWGYIANGEDPEPTSAQWVEATLTEVKAVVREMLRRHPEEKGSEWVEDFVYSHRWLRRAGYREVEPALRASTGVDEFGRNLVQQSKGW